LEWKFLIHFKTICILYVFDLFYGNLVYFVDTCYLYTFTHFFGTS
jgi:hypothetical protein